MYCLRSNRAQLSSNSKYFFNAFSGRFSEKNEVSVTLENNNIVLFEILLNYLLLDHIVIPKNMSYQNWMELYELAECFCLGRLMIICEQQICHQIADETCSNIIEFGLKNQIESLALSCADYIIKSMVNKEDKYQLELAGKT